MGGTARPSALAVLKLIASSKWVSVSIGGSPVLALSSKKRARGRAKDATSINQLANGLRLAAEAARFAAVGRGALTFGVTSAQVFCRSRPELASPDLQLLFTPASYDAARFGELEDLVRECRDLIEYSRAKQNIQGWAMGVREARACMDQQNKMLGLYDQVDPRVAQGRSQRLIEVVSAALEKHPEAKEDVLAAIDQVRESESTT